MEARPDQVLPSFTTASGRIPTILWTTDRALILTSLVGAGAGAAVQAGNFAGVPVQQLFPDLSPDSVLFRAHNRALLGEPTTVRADIAGRALHARVEPLLNQDGAVTGVIGTAHDDTEHHVIEKALRLSEESYRGLIERAPFAICQSAVSGQLLQVNQTMVDLLGYESETDLLLLSLRSDISVTPTCYDRFLTELARDSSCQGFECQWRQQDGTAIDVSMAGRALRDSNGAISHLEIIAENVTERKRLETQLRQGQRIQAIGQLAAGIAHDFNNLLSVISGEAEMLMLEALGNDALYQRGQAIEDATERAGNLTGQLLAFTRKQILQPRLIDLNSLIARMNQMLVRLLGDMIQVTFVPGPDPGRIVVDPSQLEQVVMNLAVNARDAMPHGGRLRIETRQVVIDTSHAGNPGAGRTGEFVVLEVSDSGQGIEPAIQPRIFDPFFTTKPLGQGTGLGLSVVYSVVKQCGGFINVESSPGKGAVFTLYFESAQGVVEEASPLTEQESHRPCNETLLLAEDDQMNRRLYSEFLESLGYRVLQAGDDLSAMKLADVYKTEIDILVTDLMMPVEGGYKLADTLQAAYPRLKVIFISGMFEDFGATGTALQRPFLQKPFRLRSLADKIREVLRD